MFIKNNYVLIVFFSITSIPCANQAKIWLFSYSHNRPDFIEIQYKTFKKFLLDDYEFVIFNDAKDEKMCEKIEHMCNKYCITHIRIPQEIHDRPYLERLPRERELYHHPTVRNCNVVQYSLDTLGFDHNDIVALFDSDLFLIKPFSIREYLKGSDLAGHLQIREHINYLWIGLVFLDMAHMPNKSTLNFNCGEIDNIPIDAGGHTHDYLKQNPHTQVKYFSGHTYPDSFWCYQCIQNHQLTCTHTTSRLQEAGFNAPLIKFIQSGLTNTEIFLYDTFLHYRGGSNWNLQTPDYHERKTQILKTFIEEILKN